MSLLPLGGIFRYPDMRDMNLIGSAATQTFDGITDLITEVFQVPATGTISKVHYRIPSVSSPLLTVRVELRTVDPVTGWQNPAGTLYGSSTSITVVNPTTGFKTAAVNATGATAGDTVALCIDISAYTSGSFQLTTRMAGAYLSNGRFFPYTVPSTVGSPIVAFDQWNCFGIEYGTDTFYPMVANVCTGTVGTVTTGSGSNPRVGNRFRAPAALRAIGIAATIDMDADCVLRLRKLSDDSILGTCTIDKDRRGASTGGYMEYLFDGGANAILQAGVDYYAMAENSNLTNVTLGSLTAIPSNAQLDQTSGGKNCYQSIYTGSVYNDTNTTRVSIGILYDAIDDGFTAIGNAG